MGESKRKREAATINGIDDSRLLEAARIMELIDVQNAGNLGCSGACGFRSLIGSYVLLTLGIRAQLYSGGLIYRVGPDPKRDVIKFCAPEHIGNLGVYTAVEGPCAYHSWLFADGYNIDFSVGNWPAMTRRAEDRPCPEGLQWTVDPAPSYWVKRADKEWKLHGVPDIGKAWYGPMHEASDDINVAIYAEREKLQALLPAIVDVVRRDGKRRTLVFDKNVREHCLPNQITAKELAKVKV